MRKALRRGGCMMRSTKTDISVTARCTHSADTETPPFPPLLPLAPVLDFFSGFCPAELLLLLLLVTVGLTGFSIIIGSSSLSSSSPASSSGLNLDVAFREGARPPSRARIFYQTSNTEGKGREGREGLSDKPSTTCSGRHSLTYSHSLTLIVTVKK